MELRGEKGIVLLGVLCLRYQLINWNKKTRFIDMLNVVKLKHGARSVKCDLWNSMVNYTAHKIHVNRSS